MVALSHFIVDGVAGGLRLASRCSTAQRLLISSETRRDSYGTWLLVYRIGRLMCSRLPLVCWCMWIAVACALAANN